MPDVLRTDDLVIPQGVTWGVRWPLTDPAGDPLDVSSWGVKAQIRARVSDAAVLHEFSTSLGNATADSDGVTITVQPFESSGWQWTTGRYDLELTSPGGDVYRVSQGGVRVDPEVTRN